MIYVFEEKNKHFMLDTSACTFFGIQKEHWNLLKEHVSKDSTISTEELMKIHDSYKENPSFKEFVESIKELYNLGYLLNENETNPNLFKPFNLASVGSIIIFITEQCNFSCIYCYEHANLDLKESSKNSISIETLNQTLDLFLKDNTNNHIDISFFGGEALLYPNRIKEAVSFCNERIKSLGKTVSYSLTTNGMFLTPDLIDFLANERFSLVVSCDGPEEIQNKQRVNSTGYGNYSKLSNNLKLLLENFDKRRITIRATSTNLSLDLVSVYNYFLDLGFISVSIEPAIFPSDNPYAINESDLLKAYEDLAETYCEVKKKRPELSLFLFEQVIKRIKNARPLVKQCGLGAGVVAIAPDGKIYPCQRFVGYKELSIGDVETGIHNIELRNILAELSVDKKAECSDCWAKYICGGGCPAESYELFKDFSKANEIKCSLMKKLIGLSAWIYYNCYDIYNPKKEESCKECDKCS